MKLCPICEAEYTNDAVRCPVDQELLVLVGDRRDDLVGVVLSERYRLEELIGEGGMGAVYRGIQEPVGRSVAVKVLRAELANEKEVVRRFFNEARMVSKLRHPNTVTLFDFGQSDDGALYIAMEFLTGNPLSDLIAQSALTLPMVVEITDQVCQALEEAHELGIVHRDLKPENIFIDEVGKRHMVKVLDFGIAKDISDRMTLTGTVFGTPTYMSPEQAQGHHVDNRTDVYSLGVVLYEMLSGRPPFEADRPMQVALQHVTTAPKPILDMTRLRPLPLGLSALVMDMLEKEAARRPQSVTELRGRLLKVAKELPGLRVEQLDGTRVQVRVEEVIDTMPEAWKGDTLLSGAAVSVQAFDGAPTEATSEATLMLSHAPTAQPTTLQRSDRSVAPTLLKAVAPPDFAGPNTQVDSGAFDTAKVRRRRPGGRRSLTMAVVLALMLAVSALAIAVFLGRSEGPQVEVTEQPPTLADTAPVGEPRQSLTSQDPSLIDPADPALGVTGLALAEAIDAVEDHAAEGDDQSDAAETLEVAEHIESALESARALPQAPSDEPTVRPTRPQRDRSERAAPREPVAVAPEVLDAPSQEESSEAQEGPAIEPLEAPRRPTLLAPIVTPH